MQSLEELLRSCATIIPASRLFSAALDFIAVACIPQRIAVLRHLVQNDGYCAIIAVLIIAQVLRTYTTSAITSVVMMAASA